MSITCHKKVEILIEACFLDGIHLENLIWAPIADLLKGTFVFLDLENMIRHRDFDHMLPRS